MYRSLSLDVALVALCLSLTPARSTAAPGELDPAFGGFGNGGRIQNLGYTANAMAIDAQGRLVLAGTDGFTFYLERRSGLRFEVTEHRSILIDSEQSLAVAHAVAIAPDGKIVVAGTVRFSGRQPDIAIARLNPDLSLDTTLADDGTTTADIDNDADTGLAVAVQSDHKIIVAGGARPHGTISTSEDWVVERFKEDGTLDPAFNGTGKWTYGPSSSHDESASAVALQDDGGILVAGDLANGVEPEGDFAIARLDPNGSLDDDFGSGGILETDFGGSETAASLALTPDGMIVAAGATGAARDMTGSCGSWSP